MFFNNDDFENFLMKNYTQAPTASPSWSSNGFVLPHPHLSDTTTTTTIPQSSSTTWNVVDMVHGFLVLSFISFNLTLMCFFLNSYRRGRSHQIPYEPSDNGSSQEEELRRRKHLDSVLRVKIWGSDDKEDDASVTGGQQKGNHIDFCQQPTDTTTTTKPSSSSLSLTLDDNGSTTIPNGSEDCPLVVGATALPTTDCNCGNKPCDAIAANGDGEEAIGDHVVVSSSSTIATTISKTNRNDDDVENGVGEQIIHNKDMAEEADKEDGKAYLETTSSLEDDLQSPSCPICMEPFRPGDAVCLPSNERCNHNFHVECMKDWLMKHTQCPCCRELYLLEYTTTTTTRQ